MRPSVMIAFLAAFLAAAVEHPLKETVPLPMHASVDMLLNIMTAMDRALDFMATQTDLLNLDGAIGLRIVADQLRVFLDHHGGPHFGNSSVRRDLLTDLNNLRWKAKVTADIAIPKVRMSQPEYFNTLGVLLQDGQWALDYPIRLLPTPTSQTDPTSQERVLLPFVEAYSDACVHELTGSSSITTPPCNISDYCWRLMTSKGYVGYAITHQVLYLEIGEMTGCGHQLAQLSSASGQGNVSVMQDEFCYQILAEAENIEARGYPQGRQDLLMEQIALCGILGYREFLNEDWLKEIISWQDPLGCYTRPEFEENRVKREDKKLQGSCSSHKTAVALGAMVASARFLLGAIIDGATFM